MILLSAPVRSQRECVFRCCVLKCRKKYKKKFILRYFYGSVLFLFSLLLLLSRRREKALALVSDNQHLAVLSLSLSFILYFDRTQTFFISFYFASFQLAIVILINKLSWLVNQQNYMIVISLGIERACTLEKTMEKFCTKVDDHYWKLNHVMISDMTFVNCFGSQLS